MCAHAYPTRMTKQDRKKLARLRNKAATAIVKEPSVTSDSESSDGGLAREEIMAMLSESTRACLSSHLKSLEESSGEAPKENFGLSQFWYDDASADKLCDEACRYGGKVAFLSCPSIYRAFSKRKDTLTADCVLFEYDRELAALVEYPDTQFVYYDFQGVPEEMVPSSLVRQCDMIMIDPPYLNEECLMAFFDSVALLSHEHTRVVIMTGAVLEPVISRRLPNFHRCVWEPVHESKLGNAFCCYANYEPEGLGGFI